MRNVSAKILLRSFALAAFVGLAWLAAGPLGYRRPYEWWMHFLFGLVTLPFIAANAIVVQLIVDEYFGNGRHARWLREGRCGECGYNLKGNVSGVCPECGMDVPESGSADRSNSDQRD